MWIQANCSFTGRKLELLSDGISFLPALISKIICLKWSSLVWRQFLKPLGECYDDLPGVIL